MQQLNTSSIDLSWKNIINASLSCLDPHYIQSLQQNSNWLPGHQNIFNAFSLPLTSVKYVLFGESPYPRQQSANGYAFWDGAVHQIWSETGLAKNVNRATSLRNFIKMLLRAGNRLKKGQTNQSAIVNLSKDDLVTTIDELFNNMLRHGFLLLNTSLVLSDKPVRYDAQQWRPFIENILNNLLTANKANKIQLILLGSIARDVDRIATSQQFVRFYAEHPYNTSFIENTFVHDFFKPFDLLKAISY